MRSLFSTPRRRRCIGRWQNKLRPKRNDAPRQLLGRRIDAYKTGAAGAASGPRFREGDADEAAAPLDELSSAVFGGGSERRLARSPAPISRRPTS